MPTSSGLKTTTTIFSDRGRDRFRESQQNERYNNNNQQQQQKQRQAQQKTYFEPPTLHQSAYRTNRHAYADYDTTPRQQQKSKGPVTTLRRTDTNYNNNSPYSQINNETKVTRDTYYKKQFYANRKKQEDEEYIPPKQTKTSQVTNSDVVNINDPRLRETIQKLVAKNQVNLSFLIV
jgi:hypothetical protein